MVMLITTRKMSLRWPRLSRHQGRNGSAELYLLAYDHRLAGT